MCIQLKASISIAEIEVDKLFPKILFYSTIEKVKVIEQINSKMPHPRHCLNFLVATCSTQEDLLKIIGLATNPTQRFRKCFHFPRSFFHTFVGLKDFFHADDRVIVTKHFEWPHKNFPRCSKGNFTGKTPLFLISSHGDFVMIIEHCRVYQTALQNFRNKLPQNQFVKLIQPKILME